MKIALKVSRMPLSMQSVLRASCKLCRPSAADSLWFRNSGPVKGQALSASSLQALTLAKRLMATAPDVSTLTCQQASCVQFASGAMPRSPRLLERPLSEHAGWFKRLATERYIGPR